MREIGLHIRVTDSFLDVAHKALKLKVPFFQCFMVLKSTGAMIQTSEQDIENFLTVRREHFNNLYVHGSYWINLARGAHSGFRPLYRELALAKRLEFTHMILHPGSAKQLEDKYTGIDNLAYALNTLFKHEQTVKIVLENSAHGSLSVGGDLEDFVRVLEKLDHPEKLLFCIDTAHAYSYGYDIGNAQQREEFINFLDTALGIEKIALIHLNDTHEKLGSKIDKHEILGTGALGQEVLKAFCLHEKLAHTPVLMELPVVPYEQEEEMLAMVREWHTR